MDDMLFDVPRNRTRLEITMEKYTIHTQDNGDKNDPTRWLAVWMPPCRKMGYGVTESSDLFDLYSKVGRLIDEGDYSGYGVTEEEAVLEVCRKNNIQVVL